MPLITLLCLVSFADVQAYRLDRAAEWLASELPPESVEHLLVLFLRARHNLHRPDGAGLVAVADSC